MVAPVESLHVPVAVMKQENIHVTWQSNASINSCQIYV